MVKEIPLTQGKVALVDDEDFNLVKKFKWHAWKNHNWSWYARRSTTYGEISMHRLITDTPSGMEVDHINGDGLDNRRSNLRICTRANNSRNRIKAIGKTSNFKGITLARGKWQSSIRVEDTLIYLGRFESEVQAALAYDTAATKYFGEFAKTNFINV